MDHLLRKRYENHAGVDLKSNDLTRSDRFASTMRNAQYRDSGAPEKRKGYQGHGASVGGFGQWTYNRVNPTTGADEAEIVALDQNLYRLLEATLTVAYAGAESNCRISIFLDSATSQYRCQIDEGTTQVLDYALGAGFDEASPITLSQLATQINALAGFTATVSGTSSTPAAFLKITRDHDLATATGENLVVSARYSEQINSTVSNPLSTYYGQRNAEDFELASAVNLINCLYIASGHDQTMKYDGQTFYRAGLPAPASVASVVGAAGAVTGNNYYHRATYVQYDAAGNIIEANATTVTSGINLAAERATVTVANIQAGTGYNTNCAIVAGAQVTVNQITVDNGSGGTHTMKVGDTAYFYDSVSAAYVEREVTAISSTTITVAGAAVTVADNAVISNNLRIAIWRSKTSGSTPSLYYLADEIPNNSFAATQTYDDNKADASLGALYIPPLSDRSPPPKARYITQWDGSCMLAGNHENPNYLYASQDGPEYFPADTNQWDISTSVGDHIAGIAQNNEVFVILKDESFAVANGEIGTGSIRIEIKSQDNGCVAHATIQEVNGVLCWLSKKGPRCSIGGQVPRPLGEHVDPLSGQSSGASRIDPSFNNAGKPETEQFAMKRAVAINDTIGKKYLLFVPAESETASTMHPNSNSKVFAYDYTRDAWLLWDNLNFAGGVNILEGVLYFRERRYSSFAGAVTFVLYRRHDLEDAYDYADHTSPIGGTDDDAWDYSQQWEALGEPSVLKRALLVRIFCLEEMANNDFDLTVIQEMNYQADVTRAEFDFEIPGTGYGAAEYGNDEYGDPAQAAAYHELNRERCFSWRLRFQNNTLHENPILSGWETECVAPFRAEMKK